MTMIGPRFSSDEIIVADKPGMDYLKGLAKAKLSKNIPVLFYQNYWTSEQAGNSVCIGVATGKKDVAFRKKEDKDDKYISLESTASDEDIEKILNAYA